MNNNDLLICTHATCYSYCDTTREKNGDYLEIGRIYFSPLRMKIFDESEKYKEVHEIMKTELFNLSKVDSIQVSASGQTTAITHH